MNHSISLHELREQVVYQLIVLGEEKNHFLDAYFPMHGKDRTHMDQFLSTYTRTVEEQLALTDLEVPAVVLIGSLVRITYLDDQSTDDYTIVYPNDADPEENRISFLSPVGRQLLLKKAGDTLTIATPSGTLQVRIESIRAAAIKDNRGTLD
ncbi:GreA/GreB family elongation factor [Paenibacillus eucommiae]|uniref:Transcription elongation factor GreA n=1 Tax=Paenibacillus eucommiae TaxID=1355755 RepID=A0ABS4J8Z5_9BACL|nr:GreA/GreB family elongation factor [Paenibacillus eucommiae]MBP1996328.1 transcription elongation factor GreA [Paenibacillus eucommiae]